MALVDVKDQKEIKDLKDAKELSDAQLEEFKRKLDSKVIALFKSDPKNLDDLIRSNDPDVFSILPDLPQITALKLYKDSVADGVCVTYQKRVVGILKYFAIMREETDFIILLAAYLKYNPNFLKEIAQQANKEFIKKCGKFILTFGFFRGNRDAIELILNKNKDLVMGPHWRPGDLPFIGVEGLVSSAHFEKDEIIKWLQAIFNSRLREDMQHVRVDSFSRLSVGIIKEVLRLGGNPLQSWNGFLLIRLLMGDTSYYNMPTFCLFLETGGGLISKYTRSYLVSQEREQLKETSFSQDITRNFTYKNTPVSCEKFLKLFADSSFILAVDCRKNGTLELVTTVEELETVLKTLPNFPYARRILKHIEEASFNLVEEQVRSELIDLLTRHLSAQARSELMDLLTHHLTETVACDVMQLCQFSQASRDIAGDFPICKENTMEPPMSETVACDVIQHCQFSQASRNIKRSLPIYGGNKMGSLITKHLRSFL